MTDLQLPEWIVNLGKKPRQKLLRQCDNTILCIPSETRIPLDENEVVEALGIKRAVVLRDDKTGGYWVRCSDDESIKFFKRLHDRGLPGYKARRIERKDEEWERLAERIGDILGLRNGSGPSQPPSSVEPEPDVPSTSGSSHLGVEENLGLWEGEGSSSSLGSEPGNGAPSSGASGPSILGGESTHVSGAPHPEVRPRKRRRLDRQVSQQATSPPTTNPAPEKSTPLLGIALAKLPPELFIRIFELCFEDEASWEEHKFILEELASQGGRCLQVLKGVSSLWTRIISTSSEAHINLALELSDQRLLHIEGRPKPSLGDAANVRDLGRFLRDIDPHRNRWGSVTLLFPSKMLRTVKKKLSSPAPNLEELSLSVADAGLGTDLALPLNEALHEEIGRPLEILGGRSDKLQRVLLNNIPWAWDPSPFTAIIDLALMNGVHLHPNQLFDFLRYSSRIKSIRFVNVKFIGGTPQVLEDTVPLPHLRALVLAEPIHPVGLSNFFLSLDAQNCVHTRLDIRPGGAAMVQPAFRLRVAPIVKKALVLGKPSFLLFRSNTNSQGASWRSRDGGDDGRNDENPYFEITFRGAGGGFAGWFCDFVRQVRESIGDMGETVVDVGRSVSGTIDEPFDLEDQIIPTLLPSAFAELNVVEVRAVVVAGFLELFKDMLGPVGAEGWCFRALRTIRLCAIDPQELTVLPNISAQCSLNDLINHLRREHDGIDLKEPKPDDEHAMVIALKGWFEIPTEMGQALEKGDVVSGIKIDHTEAVLAYVRVQEKGKEREVVEDVVEEYGSD
ncbi:hypothetical protein FRC00_005398 [Tulasnella sp. 408]|nr:hypothetical protein FRC00_005398 [Tulasnella sp. 408]